MATNNAINSNIPIEVAKGGTAATTLLDHGVLVGSGTSPITALTVGTTGQLLVGASSADPAFASSADGDFTFTSSTASTVRTLTVSNTDNTVAATSAARVSLIAGGGNVGDPQITYTVDSVNNWSSGIDNSSSDAYTISASDTLGSTNVFTIDTTGNHLLPLNPCFLAYNSTARTNVTGDGTAYTVIFNTEVTDQLGNYNTSTGVFQAPITGHYWLTTFINFDDVGAGHTLGLVEIITSNNTFYTYQNPSTYRGKTSNKSYIGLQVLCDMDASDTAYVQVTVSNSTKTIDLTSTAVENLFGGFLQG